LHLDKKGQASAELLLVTVVFLIIAGSLINLASSEMDKADTGDLGHARVIGEKAAETINTVYINGNGYSANLSLPNLGSSYTVNVYSNGNMSVIYKSNNITIKLIPTNVQSFNMNNGTVHQVKNNNGAIIFT
jgi:uncharacterized protein (UPF0333 family)